MPRRERPDMGEGLGGFDDLYPVARKPEADPPGESGAATVPEAPGPAPRPIRPPKAVERGATPQDGPERTTVAPRAKWGEGRTRNTRSFSITEETFERMRRCAFAEGAGMSELAERALVRALDLLEERRGEPYPPIPDRQGSPALEGL